MGESTIEKVLSYTYDPAGRTLSTTTKALSETIATSHYAGPGSTPAWTSEGESYTLDIAGIDGSLTAIKKFGEPAVLQLHDLKGDIVGTCGVKEGEYTLTSTYDSTEFGVPSKDAPLPKSGLAWLGAAGVKAELASGVIAENGSSYVPEIGTVLQTEPIVPPGADAEGSYSGAPYVTHLTAADVGADLAWGAGAPGRELVRQEEIRRHKEKQEAHANEASEAGGGEPEEAEEAEVGERSFEVGALSEGGNAIAAGLEVSGRRVFTPRHHEAESHSPYPRFVVSVFLTTVHPTVRFSIELSGLRQGWARSSVRETWGLWVGPRRVGGGEHRFERADYLFHHHAHIDLHVWYQLAVTCTSPVNRPRGISGNARFGAGLRSRRGDSE